MRNLKNSRRSETGFNFSRNKLRQALSLCIILLENMLLNDVFDATIRTNAEILVVEYSERSWN